MEILFVCTGNTCRSPMAEALFNHASVQSGLAPEISARSAGVFASGQPATGPTLQVMARRGLDLSGHSSRLVSPDIIARASLVLAMTREHHCLLVADHPKDSIKIFVLGDYVASVKADVPDPYGGTMADYESTAALISDHIDRLVSAIKQGTVKI